MTVEGPDSHCYFSALPLKSGGTVPPLQKVGVRVPPVSPVPPESYAYDYLDCTEWVAEEDDISIRVYHSEVRCQSFQNHLSSDVHLTYKVRLSVETDFSFVRIIGIVEARYIPHQLASPAADSDEEEVVDAMCSKAGLVEVDRHVDVSLVDHG